MINQRSAAIEARRMAEKMIDGIPDTLTLQTVEDIKSAMRSILEVTRANFEFTDDVALN